MPGPEIIDEASWLGLTAKDQASYLIKRSFDNARIILDFDLNSTKNYALQNMMLQSKLKIITEVLHNAMRSIDPATDARGRRMDEQREQIFGEMAADYRKLREVK